MVTDGTKERIILQKKWLGAMAKEFIELPYRHQEEILAMMRSFIDSCRRAHEESKAIRERVVTLHIEDVNEEGEWWCATGTADGVIGKIVVKYPRSPFEQYPQKIHVGKRISHMVYSLNGKDWYSSKSLLIKRVG